MLVTTWGLFITDTQSDALKLHMKTPWAEMKFAAGRPSVFAFMCVRLCRPLIVQSYPVLMEQGRMSTPGQNLKQKVRTQNKRNGMKTYRT